MYIGTLILFLLNHFYKYYDKKQFIHAVVVLIAFISYNYKGVSFYGLGVSTLFYIVFYLEYFKNRKEKI